jgi:hypothetical protein
LTRILKATGSNLTRNSGYFDWSCRGFSQFLQRNARVVPRSCNDRLLPNLFQFFYSSIILQFDAIESSEWRRRRKPHKNNFVLSYLGNVYSDHNLILFDWPYSWKKFYVYNHSSKTLTFAIKRTFIPLYTAEYQFLSYVTDFWEVLHKWTRTNVASSKFQCTIYREILAFVDRFMALHFTATGAPPAARRIIILSMNQYAWWPIPFEIKESGLYGPLDDIMFYGVQCGSCVEICLWFVISGRQLSAQLAAWFQLQRVPSRQTIHNKLIVIIIIIIIIIINCKWVFTRWQWYNNKTTDK